MSTVLRLTKLLERLATYKLNTYTNKPCAIDAVAAAKCGWVNDGKERLVYGLCKVSSVLAGQELRLWYVQEQSSRGARRVQAYPVDPFVASVLEEKQRM